MTLRVIDGGDAPQEQHEPPDMPEPDYPIPTNDTASELYSDVAQVIAHGGYTNRAVITGLICLVAHALDSAGLSRMEALPELVRMYFQIAPVQPPQPGQR